MKRDILYYQKCGVFNQLIEATKLLIDSDRTSKLLERVTTGAYPPMRLFINLLLWNNSQQINAVPISNSLTALSPDHCLLLFI